MKITCRYQRSQQMSIFGKRQVCGQVTIRKLKKTTENNRIEEDNRTKPFTTETEVLYDGNTDSEIEDETKTAIVLVTENIVKPKSVAKAEKYEIDSEYSACDIPNLLRSNDSKVSETMVQTKAVKRF